jgi:hypothetical protein
MANKIYQKKASQTNANQKATKTQISNTKLPPIAKTSPHLQTKTNYNQPQTTSPHYKISHTPTY